jgi:pimeloyl-ACP methyl ester carboxylesterase
MRGYSPGGGVALQTAIRHPDVVRKLVLASTLVKQDGADPASCIPCHWRRRIDMASPGDDHPGSAVEEHRAQLRSVAYRMLGSLTEADDAVQDTWLRLSPAGADEVENLGGWLTTAVARVCRSVLQPGW